MWTYRSARHLGFAVLAVLATLFAMPVPFAPAVVAADATADVSLQTTAVPVLSAESGYDAQFLVFKDGRVAAWGENKDGQLGDGTLYRQFLPKMTALTDVMQAASSGHVSYVLRRDGTVWRLGGSFDEADGLYRPQEPKQVEGLKGIVSISAGSELLMALDSGGTVWTAGNDLQGQSRASADAGIPVRVGGLPEIAAISAGGYHMMALSFTGEVWTWGYNYYGAIGSGTKATQMQPLRVPALGGAKAIAAGTYSSNALLKDGTVWTWGRTEGLAGIRQKPEKLPLLSGSVAISAGSELLALRANGTVRTPAGAVPGLAHVVRMNAGRSLHLFQTKDGSVYSLGFGYAGDGKERQLHKQPVLVKKPLIFAVNGKPVMTELSPMYRGGHLYVSHSELFKSLGVEARVVFSDPDPKAYNAVYTTWSFTRGEKRISFDAKDKRYLIGGEPAAVDAPLPFAVNGSYSSTTMFPLRFLCEQLGIAVAVDAKAGTVTLTSS